MNTDIEQIIGLINSGNTVAIAAHVNPDGDAVGSCFAMALALKKLGMNPIVLLENYNDKFNIIPGKEFVYKGDVKGLNVDVFLALDCADKARLGNFQSIFDKSRITINIDHHVSNTEYAMYNYVNSLASSTSEIIFDVVNMYVPIDKEVASAIYAGIIYDTGGFRHSSTKAKTHIIVSKLMHFDFPFTELYDELMHNHSYSEAKSFGLALSNLEACKDYPIMFSTLSFEEMKKNNLNSNDFDGIVEYILNIRGNEVAVFCYCRNENEVKVSMRSLHLDVSEIAKQFGGGGHVHAAGCTIKDKISNAVDLVLKEIKGRL